MPFTGQQGGSERTAEQRALTYDVIGTLNSVTLPGRSPTLPDRSSDGPVPSESKPLIGYSPCQSVPFFQSSAPPSRTADIVGEAVTSKGPHSFRLSPGDRGRRRWVSGGAHPGGSASVSYWLPWVPVAVHPPLIGHSAAARAAPAPPPPGVCGLSRRSRRKRQDNGDPGRRVRPVWCVYRGHTASGRYSRS